MYVESGTKELVCAKMQIGLHEEEEREFDEFVSLCLRLKEGESFYYYYYFIFFLIGFWFLGRKRFYFILFFKLLM